VPPLLAFLIAAQPTTMEKLRHVPKDTWINLALCVIAIAVIVRMWRALKNFNEYAPYFAMALAGSMIVCYWVYERTEPSFLSPVVAPLSHFLPSKGIQQERVERVRNARE
jgi:hypothetical protein